MIDIKDFDAKEVSGLATLVRITKDSIAIAEKRFDPNTGAELPEQVTGGNIPELKARTEELDLESATLKGFIVKAEGLVSQDEKEVI